MEDEIERPAKRMRLNFMDQVKIVIYPKSSKTAVYVPKQLITARSAYFKKACKDSKYAKEGCVSLPSTASSILFRYLHVMHFDEVGKEDDEQNDPAPDTWTSIVCTYLLAEKFEDPVSMNIIMDKLVLLIHEQRELQEGVLSIHIYSVRLAKSHPLKRLVIDSAVEYSTLLGFPSHLVNNPFVGPFIFDVAQSLSQKRDAERTNARGALESKNYHVAVEKA